METEDFDILINMNRNLDLDLLRSFVAVADLGSISAAAQRVGRTQSAVSLQMDRLAEALGFPLLERKGRGIALSARGAAFLDDARRLLDLNDHVLGQHVYGGFAQPLRLGFVQDVGEGHLERVFARVSASLPQAPLTVRVCSTRRMIEYLRTEELDMAVGFRLDSDLPTSLLRREPMQWIASRTFRLDPLEPVPLVLFEEPCIFRSAALSALNGAGRAFRIAFTSPSLPGLMAAVGAGIGLTVRTARALRPGLCALADAGASAFAAPLPDMELALYARAGVRGEAFDLVTRIISDELSGERPLYAVA